MEILTIYAKQQRTGAKIPKLFHSVYKAEHFVSTPAVKGRVVEWKLG